jgi:hypothetical protein
MLIWLRRLLAAPLVLVAFICAIGAMKIFRHSLPDSTIGEGVSTSILALILILGALWLLRPDLSRVPHRSFAEWRAALLRHPLGLALVCYLASAIVMFAAPSFQVLPGFVALTLFSLAAPIGIVGRRRWWLSAVWALAGWLLLFFVLAATAEAITPRGYGEAAMVFLLPMEIFPVALILSGLVRLFRGAPSAS